MNVTPLKKVFAGAAVCALALGAGHLATQAFAANPEELSSKETINGKEYVFSSDYATRLNSGASDDQEKQEKSHFVIQNGAMIEKVVDPEAQKAGKVHWRATFNRDRLNNYGTDTEALDSASAHTSNPYFNIALSKGLKFANDQVGITTYWRDTNDKIIGKTAQVVKMPAYKGDPDTESVKNFKHPTDKEQYLRNLWYYNEPNDVRTGFGDLGGIWDGDSTYANLAQYLRTSVRSEFDPSNEGNRPRKGGFSWSKNLGTFSKLSNPKQFNDTYAGVRDFSNKASTALSLLYNTPGTSTSANQKNATVVVDFLTEFDSAYKGDAAGKDHYVMAYYKSLDDGSDFNRADIIKFAPAASAPATAEKWKVKVDETAKNPAKVVPSHRLVINTNGAGTFQNEVKNTTGAAQLTKDYVINSPVKALQDTDPVYITVADVDGKVLPFASNIGAPEKPRTGTYGGYDFTVKQAKAYDYSARQSHWSVEWSKRDDHGTGFYPEYITRVKIINPPTKTDYKVGEPFAADGMMVELTDEGGNKLLVTPDEFDKYKLKMDPADKSKLDKPGQNQPVTVTYTPKPEINDTTPINVSAGNEKDADKYTPEVKKVDTKKGEVPDPASQITNKSTDPKVEGKTNLPDKTTFAYTDKDGNPTKPDVSKGGDVSTFIKVTYPDGTSEVVPATIHVNTDAEQWKKDNTDDKGNFTGKGTATVEQGKSVTPGDVKVTPALPADAKVTEVGTVDTSKPTPAGQPAKTTGTVTFKDGSTINNLPVEVTVTPKAATGDPVIVVDDPKAPVPAGYVRLTFDAKEGNFGKDANGQPITKKYLDVKKDLTGKELKDSGKLPANPAAEGKTFKAWDPALPGDTDKVTETKTYGATYDSAAPAKPVVDKPKGGDEVVKVGVPTDADTVEVTLPNGKKVTVKKDGDTWKTGDGAVVPVKDGKLEIPTGTPLKAGDKVTVVNKKGDKESPKNEVTVDPSDADNYEPLVKKTETPKDKLPNASDLITNKHGDPAIAGKKNLPDGTKFEYVDEKGNPTKPDVSTAGDKPVKIKVTYPDGSSEVVDGTITVTGPTTNPTEADNYKKANPDGKGSVTVKKNETPDPAKVTVTPALPDGAKVTEIAKVDTSKATEDGKPLKTTGTVVFKDGSKIENFPIEVTVSKGDADKYTPEVDNKTIEEGQPAPKPEEMIKNKSGLPAGTKYEYAETPDVSTPGEHPVKIKVTYPDGTSEVVDGTITVTGKEDGVPAKPTVETPKAGDEVVKVGVPTDADTVEVTLPNGNKVIVKKDGDTWKTGDGAVVPVKDGKLEIPTGTPLKAGDIVTVVNKQGDVPSMPTDVTVTGDGAAGKTDADKYTPVGDNKTVNMGAPAPEPAELIKNKSDLPEGTEYYYVKTPGTGTPGAHPVKIQVIYPDGTSEEVDATITVIDPDAAAPAKPEVETPKAGDEVVKVKVPTDAPTINVTLPDGKVITVKKDGDKWTTGTGVEVPVKDGKLEIPTGKPLQPGDTIKVETNNGKPSEPTTVTVPKGNVPTKPVVDPIKAGDNKVKVGVPLVGDTVVVKLPDGSEVVVKKDPATGKWTTGTGVEVPVVDGKLEIPVDPNKTTEGGEVTVITKKGDSVSEETKVTIGKPDSPANGKPAKPVVDPVKPGDTIIKVKVPTDAPTITVTLPDGKVIVIKKDPATGKWTTGTGVEIPVKNGKLEIPTGKPLQPGDTIKVETNNGKVPSDPTIVTVPKAGGVLPGGGSSTFSGEVYVYTNGGSGSMAVTGSNQGLILLASLISVVIGGAVVVARRKQGQI